MNSRTQHNKVTFFASKLRYSFVRIHVEILSPRARTSVFSGVRATIEKERKNVPTTSGGREREKERERTCGHSTTVEGREREKEPVSFTDFWKTEHGKVSEKRERREE